jgi:hypothetical protein
MYCNIDAKIYNILIINYILILKGIERGLIENLCMY